MSDAIRLKLDRTGPLGRAGEKSMVWPRGQRVLFALFAASASWGIVFLTGYMVYCLL